MDQYNVRPAPDLPFEIRDPRSGLVMTRENAAATKDGKAAELEGDRSYPVPWTAPWIRRYQAGEIEKRDEERGVWLRWDGARDVPVVDTAPKRPKKES